jgi:putative ABC transport system ATP-binding protein
MEPVVSLSAVSKDYPLGKLVVSALKAVDLRIDAGEFTTIAGPSGSGKTTLLNLIGCVDVPSSGSVCVVGQKTEKLNDAALTKLRLHELGFIFQSFNLIPVLTLFQNVEFPLLLQGKMTTQERKQRVEDIVDRVGLTQFIKHRPNELSGGQRQRVAIARALVTKPSIVLADEPTANLDSGTGQQIIELMKEINRKEHTTFIFSTHDHRVIEQARRRVYLEDGQVSGDEQSNANADVPA